MTSAPRSRSGSLSVGRLLPRPRHDDRLALERTAGAPRQEAPRDLCEDHVRAPGEQLVGQCLPEGVGLLRGPAQLAAHRPDAVQRADEGAQAQPARAGVCGLARELGERRDGNLAAALERAHEGALGLNGERAGLVDERRRQRRPYASSPARASMASDPWPTAGSIWSNEKANAASSGLPETRQAGGREDQCRPCPAPRACAARVCTLPRMSTSSRSGRSAESWERRRRLDVPTTAPAGTSSSVRGAAAGPRHEDVAHVLARREGDHREAVGHGRRHVLGGVHAEVGAALEHRRLQLLGEQPLVADLGERRVQQLVALGLDDLDLHLEAGMQAPELVAHPLALDEGQLAAARADAQRAAHASSVPVPRRWWTTAPAAGACSSSPVAGSAGRWASSSAGGCSPSQPRSKSVRTAST